MQLRNVVNDIYVFTQRDECIDFLTEVGDRTAFLLIEGLMVQRILPLIHDIPQLDTVYILCRNTSKHEEWTKAWVKVRDIHTDITSIRQSLQHVVKQLNQDPIAMSFIALGERLPVTIWTN